MRPCGGAFAPARTRALALLANAITELGSPSVATTNLLARLFGGATAAARLPDITTNLTNTRSHIDTEMNVPPPPPAQVLCHSERDNDCSDSPAYNRGEGAAAVMTLCPEFLDNPGDVEENARTLIHEGTHGTAGFAAVDVAYGHTRLVNILSTGDAMRNTDSYVLLVTNINHNLGHGGPAPIGVAGDAQVAMSPPEERLAVEALGHLEKWLTQAYQDVAGTYNTVTLSVGPGAWTGPGTVPHRQTFARIAPHFGLTDVGPGPAFNPPRRRDQLRLAAVHDRFLTMRSVMWSRGVTMVKVAGGSGSWEAGPGRRVELPPAFFALPDALARVRELHELIVAAHPDISAGLRPHYVEASDLIRQDRGLGP